MAFFEVTDLHKSFGNKEVLKGVSLTLDKGQIMAVIGDSGNGKTTFLRCLNFLTEADTGTISINGETIFDANIPLKPSELRKKRMKMGLVFQSYNLFPQYTVLKNTYLAANLLVKEEASAYAKTLTNASLSEKRRLVSDFKKKRKAENVENAKQLIGSMGRTSTPASCPEARASVPPSRGPSCSPLKYSASTSPPQPSTRSLLQRY